MVIKLEIVKRVLVEHPKAQEYEEYLKTVAGGAEKQGIYAIKCQSRANLNLSKQSNWRLNSDYLASFEESTQSQFQFDPPSRIKYGSNPSGGGSGDSGDHGDDNGSDDGSNSSVPDNTNTSSADEDEQYRKIIQCLSKSLKNFGIKSLSIHSDINIRRERFKNWTTDVQNVLSTHRLTSGVLDGYPAKVPKFKNIAVDRAVKALLFSVTVGQAKELISNSTSSHHALLDLSRHFAQTSATQRHFERQKTFSLKQSFNESASEFLKRVRKQLSIAKSIGCLDFNDDEVVANIVLEGLNSSIKIYTATTAELKATLVRHPSLLTLTYFEDTFFSIDNSVSMKSGRCMVGRDRARRGGEQENFSAQT